MAGKMQGGRKYLKRAITTISRFQNILNCKKEGALAGVFLTVPQQVLGEFGDRVNQICELLPRTHAVTALRSCLRRKRIKQDVLFEMYWLIALTMIRLSCELRHSRARLWAEK